MEWDKEEDQKHSNPLRNLTDIIPPATCPALVPCELSINGFGSQPLTSPWLVVCLFPFSRMSWFGKLQCWSPGLAGDAAVALASALSGEGQEELWCLLA